LHFPLTTVISITGKKKQFLTYTQEKQQGQSLSDYAQQDLFKVTKRSTLDVQKL
jgi:hypothetical protein